MKKCDNCNELVQETIDFSGQQYCRKCVFHAKRLGAIAEITRRAEERKLPIQAIVDELIIYALEVQKTLNEEAQREEEYDTSFGALLDAGNI